MLGRACLRAIIASLLLVGLVGCERPLTLTVVPSTAIVDVGGTVAFTALDDSGSPVAASWAIVRGPGEISADGVYTAPQAVSEATNAVVAATYTSSTSTRPLTASAVVTVTPPRGAGIVDPQGDVFGSGAYDVVSVRTSCTSTSLAVAITFDATTPPSLPEPGSVAEAGDVVGFVDFDTDESRSSGALSADTAFCPCTPASAIGVEVFVSLFERNTRGNYDVISASSLADVGDAVPSVSGSVLTLTIPFDDLVEDDGIADLSLVIGDIGGSTDCIPDRGGALVTGSIRPSATGPPEENPHVTFLRERYGIVWTPPWTSMAMGTDTVPATGCPPDCEDSWLDSAAGPATSAGGTFIDLTNPAPCSGVISRWFAALRGTAAEAKLKVFRDTGEHYELVGESWLEPVPSTIDVSCSGSLAIAQIVLGSLSMRWWHCFPGDGPVAASTIHELVTRIPGVQGGDFLGLYLIGSEVMGTWSEQTPSQVVFRSGDITTATPKETWSPLELEFEGSFWVIRELWLRATGSCICPP